MTLLKSYLKQPRVQRILQRKGGMNGFSLIELVIVVAVLAVLAAIAVPAFQNMAESGREAAAKSSLANIYKECEVSKMQLGADGATHTVLEDSTGVTYGGDATGAGGPCTGAATGLTTGGTTYTLNLATGAKSHSPEANPGW